MLRARRSVQRIAPSPACNAFRARLRSFASYWRVEPDTSVTAPDSASDPTTYQGGKPTQAGRDSSKVPLHRVESMLTREHA